LTNQSKCDIIIVPKGKEIKTMAKSRKQLHEALRNKYIDLFIQFLTEQGEEVLRIKSNEIAFPVVDEERNDEFIKVAISVPTGSRDDGEAFDGFGIAQQYSKKVEDDRARAEADAEKKAKKIARDKAQREARARAKAEHEAKKNEGEGE
jgi:hypothetical protein